MKLFRNLWEREAPANTVPRPFCHCLDAQEDDWPDDLQDNDSRDDDSQDDDAGEKVRSWTELRIHTEVQDTECSGWARLNELIELAAADGRETFSPGREMQPGEWAQITELPKSIAKLKSVKHLNLYGSSLVRIPPEIGEMTALEEFTPYTSYRLHWFPFEITRCSRLKNSTVSTRALYGNYKYRSPFPRLPQIHPALVPQECSVCRRPLGDAAPIQYWISLAVATDVLPLLVHACSQPCIASLPIPPDDYVRFPHQGGLSLKQPEPR